MLYVTGFWETVTNHTIIDAILHFRMEWNSVYVCNSPLLYGY